MGRPIPFNTGAVVDRAIPNNHIPRRPPLDSVENAGGGGALGRLFSEMGWGWQLSFTILSGIVSLLLATYGWEMVKVASSEQLLNALWVLLAGVALTLLSLHVLLGTNFMHDVVHSPLGTQLQALIPLTIGAVTFAAIALAVLLVIAAIVLAAATVRGILES